MILFGRPGFHECHFEVSLKDGQGRFHFVGGDFTKISLDFTSALELIQYGIHRLGESPEFSIG